jgi:hypothetical protein
MELLIPFIVELYFLGFLFLKYQIIFSLSIKGDKITWIIYKKIKLLGVKKLGNIN